jgi:hypothetical protein
MSSRVRDFSNKLANEILRRPKQVACSASSQVNELSVEREVVMVILSEGGWNQCFEAQNTVVELVSRSFRHADAESHPEHK